MSVRRCQREVNSKEYAWWMAYDRIDPIGQERDDIRAALICETIAKAAGNKNCSIDDFILKFQPEPSLTRADRIQKVRAAMATMKAVK